MKVGFVFSTENKEDVLDFTRRAMIEQEIPVADMFMPHSGKTVCIALELDEIELNYACIVADDCNCLFAGVVKDHGSHSGRKTGDPGLHLNAHWTLELLPKYRAIDAEDYDHD